ncbi:hypothetical protein TNIN_378651 [Trichonephila inaurata madagascariensis]|uniref:Uncharacterized protein n=1 Tax=Trichonephila inaurata madagascariensis TaxID=2747483 RepID=A0A8X6YHX8_9ARAC|nr:hypothetical protein TNIN_378651 [Trichonephila inaurata madagascariensis]
MAVRWLHKLWKTHGLLEEGYLPKGTILFVIRILGKECCVSQEGGTCMGLSVRSMPAGLEYLVSKNPGRQSTEAIIVRGVQ